MTSTFVPFDAIWTRAVEAVESAGELPERAEPVYLVRNLHGQVRVCVSEMVEGETPFREALDRLAVRLHDRLGPHGAPATDGVLFVAPSLLSEAKRKAR